jgi:hypothetical protein
MPFLHKPPKQQSYEEPHGSPSSEHMQVVCSQLPLQHSKSEPQEPLLGVHAVHVRVLSEHSNPLQQSESLAQPSASSPHEAAHWPFTQYWDSEQQ